MPEVQLDQLPQAVIRRWIATEMRLRRERATLPGEDAQPRKITQEDAAARVGCTRGKIAHLESPTGRNVPDRLEVEALFELYGCPQDVDWFLGLLARVDKKKRTAPPARPGEPLRYNAFAGLSAGAREIAGVDLVAPNGLLQTPKIAERIIRGGDEILLAIEEGQAKCGATVQDTVEATVTEMVNDRIGRQAILTRSINPVSLWRVIHLSVLRDLPGTDAERKEQYDYLVQLGELPNVDLQVLRPQEVAHPALNGPFSILHFPIPGDPGLVYTESLIMGTFVEEPSDIARYHRIMNLLRAQAEPPEESLRLIKEMWKEAR